MERERERVRVKTTTAFIHFNNITFCTTRTSITALEMVSVLYTRARVNQSFGGGGESLEDSPRNSVNLDSIASRYSVGVIDRSTESVGETDRTSMRETKDGSFFIFSGFLVEVCSLRSSSSSPSSPSIGSSIPSSSSFFFFFLSPTFFFSSGSHRHHLPLLFHAFPSLTKFKSSKLSFLFSAFIA